MAVNRKQRKRRKKRRRKRRSKNPSGKTFERRRRPLPDPGQRLKPPRRPGAMKRMEYLKQLLLKKRNDVVRGLGAVGPQALREFGQKIEFGHGQRRYVLPGCRSGHRLLAAGDEVRAVQGDRRRLPQAPNGAYGLCEVRAGDRPQAAGGIEPGPVLHPLQNEQGRAGEDAERRDEFKE